MNIQSYETRTEFKYVFDSPMEIGLLIKSLEGYKSLISLYLPSVLSEIVGEKVDRVEIYVEEMEQGSFIEKFSVKMIFGNEKTALLFADKLGKYLGFTDIRSGDTMKGALKILISAAIVALVGYGIYRLLPSEKEQIINNITSNIINIGHQINGEEIFKIIEATLNTPQRNKKIQQETQKILAPIHNYGGEIEIEGNKVVSKDVLEKVPQEINIEELSELEEAYDDIDMDIRASDRDKITGWYVVIDNIVPKRKKLEFSEENPDLSRLANNARVRANVRVIKKLSADGKRYVIDKVVLDSFVDDDEYL